jgi:hypothetical protein
MGASSMEVRNKFLSQFENFAGSKAFHLVRDALYESTVDMTVILPGKSAIWQVRASLLSSGKWSCQVFSFLGRAELTTTQEAKLENAHAQAWEEAISKPHGEELIQEVDENLYSEFLSEQLSILSRKNPTTSNGVSFSPCQNPFDTFNEKRWWIRADLSDEQPNLEPTLIAGEAVTNDIRSSVQIMRHQFSLGGFGFMLSSGL